MMLLLLLLRWSYSLHHLRWHSSAHSRTHRCWDHLRHYRNQLFDSSWSPSRIPSTGCAPLRVLRRFVAIAGEFFLERVHNHITRARARSTSSSRWSHIVPRSLRSLRRRWSTGSSREYRRWHIELASARHSRTTVLASFRSHHLDHVLLLHHSVATDNVDGSGHSPRWWRSCSTIGKRCQHSVLAVVVRNRREGASARSLAAIHLTMRGHRGRHHQALQTDAALVLPHSPLTIAVHAPRLLVEAVVEVVRDVGTGFPPRLLVQTVDAELVRRYSIDCAHALKLLHVELAARCRFAGLVRGRASSARCSGGAWE